MEVKLSLPSITDEERRLVLQALDSGWLAHGPFNHELEEAFKRLLNVKYAVTCNSCASALFLAVKALDIQGEVIVPSFSFVATANTVVTAGAVPVFVDIDPRTCNIDPQAIEDAITPRTQAIMPVHFAGQCADMEAIMRIAQKHGLQVIEDSAETLGGTFNGRQAGSFGAGCFSFFPTKNITTGEGGMITTNDENLAKKAKAIAAHGIDSTTFEREKKENPWFRNATYAGFNLRMSNMLAALGCAQMKRLAHLNQLRVSHAQYLMKALGNIDWFELPYLDPRCHHVFQMFTIQVKDGINRDKLVKYLNDNGVRASVHFYPVIHRQAYYLENYPQYADRLPNTDMVAGRIVTLPLFPDMTLAQLDFMIEQLRAYAAVA